jgi:hypothetical protein
VQQGKADFELSCGANSGVPLARLASVGYPSRRAANDSYGYFRVTEAHLRGNEGTAARRRRLQIWTANDTQHEAFGAEAGLLLNQTPTRLHRVSVRMGRIRGRECVMV